MTSGKALQNLEMLKDQKKRLTHLIIIIYVIPNAI